ncbi:hypothetical protein BJY14_000725 [Actinomadura luteofluorescens]|uniref:Protein-tyrosine-phosphatase-like N-terminal domain-containing protein n=1 Tax=Actinomadura luteofluorescens TaxID=46163 RepID=A0A7Y9EBS4_9ACTN|nr:hypothetical protein [Actinomadura luteofluorescens]NYD44742.1 hypothetical protein [Actinomadura luteofluorescens]
MITRPGEALFDRIAVRLAGRFHGLVSTETARSLVVDPYGQLRATSNVDAHLVVLAERFAAERLTALAQAEGRLDKPVPEVLFACDANAGRSQMVAAPAMARGHGRLQARSAGIAPAAELEPAVAETAASATRSTRSSSTCSPLSAIPALDQQRTSDA